MHDHHAIRCTLDDAPVICTAIDVVLNRIATVDPERYARRLRVFYETTGARDLNEYRYRVAHLTAFFHGATHRQHQARGRDPLHPAPPE